MTKRGLRSIRGLDPWKLRSALRALPIGELSSVIGEDGRGSYEVLLQLEAALHYGLFSIRDYLRAVGREPLAAACLALGLPEDEAPKLQIRRIEAALRYQPLVSPRLSEEELSQTLSENLTRQERLLVLELHSRISRRKTGMTRLSIAEIAGRLGYFDEELTIPAGAVERVARIFGENGLRSNPDLALLQDAFSADLRVVIEAKPDWAIQQASEDAAEPLAPARDIATEREFLAWVNSRIDSSGGKIATFRLADLVNRRGRYRAERRLRASASAEVSEFLYHHGIGMTPDYRGVDKSPGIDALVGLSRQAATAAATKTHGHGKTEDPVLEYALKLGMALARSDDDVSDLEVAELHRHAQRRLASHSRQEREAVTLIIDRLRSEEIDVEATAQRIAEDLSTEEQRQLLDYLFDVAVADGVFLHQEEALLRQLHRRLDFDNDYFERLIRLCRATAKHAAADQELNTAPPAPQRISAEKRSVPGQFGKILSMTDRITTATSSSERLEERHADRAARLYNLLTPPR